MVKTNYNIPCIYIISNNVNNKVYIGQTNNFRKRKNNHIKDLRNNCHCSNHLQSSWNKYGEDNFRIEVLEPCIEDELDEKECYWIKYYNSCNPKFGYNIRSGGKQARGFVVSEETRRKMSKNHADFSGVNSPMYGKSLYDFLDEEGIKRWKENTSKAVSGEKNPFYGKTHSVETIAVLSKKAKERYASGVQNPNSKRVICVTTNEIFNTIKEAFTKYNMSRDNLHRCLNGKYKHAGKLEDGTRLSWEYL